jgi:hypothetical protein
MPREGGTEAPPGSAIGAAQVFAMASLALSAPALDLVARHPAFLATYRADTVFLLLLSLALALVLPGAPALAARGLSGSSAPWARALLGMLTFVLAWLLAQPLLDAVTPAWLAMTSGMGAALLLTLALRRLAALRQVLRLLAWVPAALLALFWLDPRIQPFWSSPAAAPGSVAAFPADASIVFLVFDELPLLSLLDAHGEIDAPRFPHFGALAATSTWFSNALSVGHSTDAVMPALLGSHWPEAPDRGTPSHQAHPQTLFTWLGSAADLQVKEEYGALCPPELCARVGETASWRRLPRFLEDLSAVYLHRLLPAGWRGWLPPLEGAWRDFWRRGAADGQVHHVDAYRRSVAGWRAAAPGAPQLIYQHALLPHWVFQFLPGGERYNSPFAFPLPQRDDPPWLALQLYQRHLLQAQAVDGLLGLARARLVELGIWERSWVVVLADHGMSLRPGRPFRGAGDLATLRSEVLPVPLFLKAPGQTTGKVDGRAGTLIDVLPTLAAGLGVAPPWPMEGVSLLGPPAAAVDPAPRLARLLGADAAAWHVTDGALAEALAWKSALPGMASGPTRGFFALSPRPALLGAAVECAAGATLPAKLWLKRPWLEAPSAPSSPSSPSSPVEAYVVGELEAGPEAEGGVVILRFDGVVKAVAPLWRRAGAERWTFAALVDPAVLHPGRNLFDLGFIPPSGQLDGCRPLALPPAADPSR